MKAIMIMYDSLNRNYLESYGCTWTKTPNFKRLAEKSVQFQNCYVGSMPCMPARRELHTGRANFLHRSWGPLEPYDDSMPELLKKNGVYTHLTSDHQHYWEDGGATYHSRYSSWEISRGQEGDTWKADLSYEYDKDTVFVHKKEAKKHPEKFSGFIQRFEQDVVNRTHMEVEEKTSQAVTFANGLEFIETNYNEDDWFLQIETFDPHEPFFTLPADKKLYPYHFSGDDAIEDDWPVYLPTVESEDVIWRVRYQYAALMSKCDRYLGKVLDKMDQYDMWKDTMLIVNTDHGFLLGEHGWWGKTSMPLYEEIAHIPLYIYDPRNPVGGQCRNALVQTMDLAPTLLEYFNVDIPENMEGKPLCTVLKDDTPIREAAVFGYYGSPINIVDGKHLYMHAAKKENTPIYEYTLMPTHMRERFNPEELQDVELSPPFSFTKGCRLMKIPAKLGMGNTNRFGDLLFDLANDGQQLEEDTVSIIEKMKENIIAFMKQNDAPEELYERYGL